MKKYVEVHANCGLFFTQHHTKIEYLLKSINGHFVVTLADFESVFIGTYFRNMNDLNSGFIGGICNMLTQAEFDEMKENYW